MSLKPPDLACPGLFITGTDTGVGKTLATCAIAASLRAAQTGVKIGLCKPLITDCAWRGGELVGEDAAALLAHCTTPGIDLDAISPVRFEPPVAPAVAAEQAAQRIDFDRIAAALETLSRTSDLLLIEGVGGLLVPIDPDDAQRTVLDLIRAIDYPTLVVARSALGTLNHTAMTIRLLRDAGCAIAGVVMNDGGDLDPDDASIDTNRRWIEAMTGTPVLARIPAAREGQLDLAAGLIDDRLINSLSHVDWVAHCGSARRASTDHGVGARL